MGFEVSKNKAWVVFLVDERLDAFNCEGFKSELDQVVKNKTSNVALNLKNTRFISLPVIKYFCSVAEDLERKGGKLALIGSPEKIKRQIDIFASLKPMLVFRDEEDWENYKLI